MHAPLSPTTAVDQIRFTVVDVETTGLHPAAGDRVCEIALLQIQGGRELARLESLVNPQRPVRPEAMQVNGIRDHMLTNAPVFPAVLAPVQALLKESVLVAHNAPFDIGFLRHEFALAGQAFAPPPVVDTLALAQAHYQFTHNSLEAIASTLGLPSTVRHRAMADVLTTWQVLQRFIDHLQQQGPVVLAHLMYPADRRPVNELVNLTSTLQEALQTGQLLHLQYQASNAETTSRVVQPLEMCYERGRGYLRAFCHLRQEERNFRFDRILGLALVSEAQPSTSAEE